MNAEVKAPHERIEAAVQRIREVIENANPGPWVYDSYSAIFSSPMMRTYDTWFNATIPEGHTVERYGECPPCGEWKEFPCGVAPSPGLGHGCRYFAEDYDRDPLIARVPAAYGDTADRKRIGDAQHNLWPRLRLRLVSPNCRVRRGEAMNETVIILFYTIMDGPVLRWYHSEAAAKHGSDYMSVSRNGVYISEFLDRIPEEEITKAKQAARELNRDRRADVSSFATHDKSFGGGRLERIERQEATS